MSHFKRVLQIVTCVTFKMVTRILQKLNRIARRRQTAAVSVK